MASSVVVCYGAALAEGAKVTDGIGPALNHTVTGRTGDVLPFTGLVKASRAMKLVV